MARLGAMILSLNESEMRAYLYLVKSAPAPVSSQKLTAVVKGVSETNIHLAQCYPSAPIISRIKKKLGKYHRIKNRHGAGYYYDSEETPEKLTTEILKGDFLGGIHLTPNEKLVVKCLKESTPEYVSVQELIKVIYGPNSQGMVGLERNIFVLIYRLRKKIDNIKGKKNMGYAYILGEK